MKSCEYQQIDPRTLSASNPSAQSCAGGQSSAQRSRRKWEVFPGKNRFYCDGRIILARQSGVLPLTLGLIVVTCGLFFAFDCPFLVEHLTVFIPVIGGVLFVFVVVSLLQTSLTDPGILPRATPDEAADVERQIDTTGTSSYRPPPRTREIVIREQVVKLKYCFTCKMFRPPRTSHCSLCDNCVERFDHHCPWVGNCVGRRNYRFFYSFIISLSFLISFIFGCVITHLTLRSQSGKGLVQSIQESPGSVVELVICFFSIWSVVGLSGFHTYLVASNLTTNEDIKGAWSSKRGAADSVNPYSHNSVFTNCCVTLCGPMPPSLIDRRGSVPPDDPSAAAAAAAAPELELPPFMAKSDTRMSPKELLERVVRSSELCLLGRPTAPKTAALEQEEPAPRDPRCSSCSSSSSSSSSSSPSSPGCWEGRPPCPPPPKAAPCHPYGRGARRGSLDSVNPAFRLALPSPALSHAPLVVVVVVGGAAGSALVPPH
ncbi:palmitoyltransferase ZDHHC18a isoform X1 [Gadus macrocephalus]|uniref:palmitoyltransferase ZDHHC18a isoform X1 n=1 Tax=Gadus macrocephalus TaxID=80720 RepID=UPI0028CB3422|nr:palmitoyltransferase ZDHHC18a isoform X1 [Gadus macrocephalus]